MDRSIFNITNRFVLFSLFLFFTVCSGCDKTPSNKGPEESVSKKTSLQATAQVNDVAIPKKIGVLLISHGSHSKQWREMVSKIGEDVQGKMLQAKNLFAIKSAFMEYTEPSIATQLKALDEASCTDIIIVPLLLAVSSHSFDDIPTIAGQKIDKATLEELKLEGTEIYKPKAKVTIAPLLDFPKVLEENVIRRVKEMSVESKEEGLVMVAYGSEPYHEEWEAMLKHIATKVTAATEISEITHCYCGHVAQYKLEPTENAIKKILNKKKTAIVVPLLVAVSENFQGRIIGGAIKNVDKEQRIRYRHDAILPDSNINSWIINIVLKISKEINAK